MIIDECAVVGYGGGNGRRRNDMTSYNHRIVYFKDFGGYYRAFWTVDRRVKNSRLRFPTPYSRDMTRKGPRNLQRSGISRLRD